jgi:hypothetical protein
MQKWCNLQWLGIGIKMGKSISLYCNFWLFSPLWSDYLNGRIKFKPLKLINNNYKNSFLLLLRFTFSYFDYQYLWWMMMMTNNVMCDIWMIKSDPKWVGYFWKFVLFCSNWYAYKFYGFLIN